MIISNITPPQVWSASQRSLTNFGSGALAPTPTVQTSIAGATQVSLRTSAGIVANTTVAVVTGVGATVQIFIELFDGSAFITMAQTAAAANSPAAFSAISTSSVGPRVDNGDATHGGFYMVAAYSLTI